MVHDRLKRLLAGGLEGSLIAMSVMGSAVPILGDVPAVSARAGRRTKTL